MRFFTAMFALVCAAASTYSLAEEVQLTDNLNIKIPVVDMRDYFDTEKKEAFLNTLYEAMTTVGFFAVQHTSIDTAVVKEAYGQSHEFFKKDLGYKMSYVRPELGGQRGFVPGEVAKGCIRKDKKEFYHIASEDSSPPNVWPDQAGFKPAFSTLFAELERYVVPLQEAIIETINLHTPHKIPLDQLNRTTKHGNNLLRVLYYPALTEEELASSDQPLYWAAPHTDIDYLAILPYATEKGLQVELNGQWYTVIVPEDSFIVNVGDMLENITNGLFVSARHRVCALEPHKDRFSMVLFVHPTNDTSLAPLPSCIDITGGVQRYAPGTRLEFLWERIIELNIGRAFLEAYSKTGHVERQLQYGRESPQVVDLLIENGLASKELLDAVHKKTNASR